MRHILFGLLMLAGMFGHAQSRPYTIASDSVLLKSFGTHGSTLIIQNATKDTIGFLYNTGNGITVFRHAAIKLNDSTYLIGADTLKIHSSGGVGGSATWGGITGTLSSQTDLQTALNGKADKVTTITINGVTFDLSANRTWTIPATDTSLLHSQLVQLFTTMLTKLNISDTAAMLSPYLKNITGLVTAGTNVTVTGSGTSGSPYVVNSSGSGGVSSGTTGFKRTTVKTSAYTAAPNDLVPVNTTSGAVTITLPTSPVDSTEIVIKHIIQGGTNAVTIATGGSDVFNKTGGSTSLNLTLLSQGVILHYDKTNAIWTVLGTDIPVSQLTLNQVSSVDSAENHTILAISPNGKDTTAIRDSIVHRIDFSSNTPTNGIKGKLLWTLQSDKYNTNDPSGFKYGNWNSWLTSNNYNFSNRRGEILYDFSYNMNNAGGIIKTGEGAAGWVLESDFNRKFELYYQVGRSNGVVYRPLFIVANKDTALGEIIMQMPVVHFEAMDTAVDYFNSRNGHLIIDQVPNRPADVSNTTFEIRNGNNGVVGNVFSITNARTNAVFSTGGDVAGYTFDKVVTPQTSLSTNLGSLSAKWNNFWVGNVRTSSLQTNAVNVTSNYTILASDYTINCTSGTDTITLPLTTGNVFTTTFGNIYEIKNSGTGAVVVNTTSSQLIDGALTYKLLNQYDKVRVQSNGSTWLVLSSNGGSITASLPIKVTGVNISADTGRANTQLITGYALNKARDSLAGLIAGGGIDQTAVQTWTNINNFTANGIGVTPTDRLVLSNSTAATLGNQQISGAVHWSGQGWKTTATAASQPVDFRMHLIPLQGAANPSAQLVLASSINSGAYVNDFVFQSGGGFTAASVTLTGNIAASQVQATSIIKTQQNGAGATSVDGFLAYNATAATGGIPVQLSPRSRWIGSALDAASASELTEWIAEAAPINGTTPIKANWRLRSQINGTGGFSDVLVANSSGLLGVGVTPTSTLQSNGSFAAGYVAKTSTYTATISDYTIECTSGTFTVTLPTAVGIAGRVYFVTNSGAGTITVGTTSSQTFANVTATPTTLTMATLGAVQVQSNGANWLQLK